MFLSEFDFELPKELIAQQPSAAREYSNLLIDEYPELKIRKFIDIVNYLSPGDVLVLNNSKVFNAKLNLIQNNNSIIGVNLNKEIQNNIWSAFAKPARKLSVGDIFHFNNEKVSVIKKFEQGEIYLQFHLNNGNNVINFCNQVGELPLPPYIKRNTPNKLDIHRYQNVFAKTEGSVAAPTAGMHFSLDLLQKIKNKGIKICYVTLHVGGGTFLPVKTNNISHHKMHEESFILDEETCNIINQAKKSNNRVIAVGTTSLRVLESCSNKDGIYPKIGSTNIFIYPGYKFNIVDTLITNFHLPKSTLFMLVCAFKDIARMKNIYHYAIQNKLRFFSYGDAMILFR